MVQSPPRQPWQNRNQKEKMELKYFKLSEFDCKSEPGSHTKMNADFLKQIDQAREYSNTPYKITSGYRSAEHTARLINKGVKTSMTSSHIKGLAVDIAVNGSQQRMQILRGLLKAGITRIGISAFFIHADADPDKAQNVIWTY
jgi:uncharacterized protein YcbK (DUF882 family)